MTFKQGLGWTLVTIPTCVIAGPKKFFKDNYRVIGFIIEEKKTGNIRETCYRPGKPGKRVGRVRW